MDEPILNYTMLKMCLKYYLSENTDPVEDCYLSPITTPDAWSIIIPLPISALG